MLVHQHRVYCSFHVVVACPSPFCPRLNHGFEPANLFNPIRANPTQPSEHCISPVLEIELKPHSGQLPRVQHCSTPSQSPTASPHIKFSPDEAKTDNTRLRSDRITQPRIKSKNKSQGILFCGGMRNGIYIQPGVFAHTRRSKMKKSNGRVQRARGILNSWSGTSTAARCHPTLGCCGAASRLREGGWPTCCPCAC